MAALRCKGLNISLDDFGTGDARLRCLPLGQLKIDRSFVQDMVIDSRGSHPSLKWFAATCWPWGPRRSVLAEPIGCGRPDESVACLFECALKPADFHELILDVGRPVRVFHSDMRPT